MTLLAVLCFMQLIFNRFLQFLLNRIDKQN